MSLLHSLYHYGTQEYGRVSRLLSRRVPISPLVFRIRVTSKCNFHCKFCYQADSLNRKEASHLSLEEWKTILKRLPRWTVIDITGGEPLLAKDFEALIDLILSMGFKTSLITNASRCTPALLEKLVKQRLTYFMVSVDGLEAYHNEARGNPRAFAKAGETLKALSSLRARYRTQFPITCVKTTLTGENFKELLPLHEVITREWGVSHHSLNLLFQNPVRGGNELHDDYNERFEEGNTAQYPPGLARQIAGEVKALMKRAEGSGRKITFKPELAIEDLEDYLGNPARFGVKDCRKTHSVVTMYHDGTLTPCDLGLRVGNIRELGYDFRKLWRQGRFLEFSSRFKAKGPYRPSCDGCCLMPHQRREPAAETHVERQ